MVEIGTKALKFNTALKVFEPLVGEWLTTGVHPYFPNAELRGRVSIGWIEGGAFLVLRSEIDHPEFPDGIQIVGSDDQAKTYYLLHFDERGVSRKYDVAIHGDQFTWWREDKHFAQRFTMEIGRDELISYGEMSRDGGEWEKDLSLTYKRLRK
ncbi:MAG TPA: hypothetical protein VLG92_02155 [Candidatus Saccharimonadia bacterium]|nr:hypothetical protein [Candidatus Saccharimonadia bacterium]